MVYLGGLQYGHTFPSPFPHGVGTALAGAAMPTRTDSMIRADTIVFISISNDLTLRHELALSSRSAIERSCFPGHHLSFPKFAATFRRLLPELGKGRDPMARRDFGGCEITDFGRGAHAKWMHGAPTRSRAARVRSKVSMSLASVGKSGVEHDTGRAVCECSMARHSSRSW